MWYFWISYSRMKRGGNFFSHFRGENKKGGQITFYSISSGGKKYAGRYVPVTTFSFTRPVEMFSLLWYVFMSFCIYEFSTGILTVFFFGVVSTDGKAKNNISLKNWRKRPFSLSFMWIFLADRYLKGFPNICLWNIWTKFATFSMQQGNFSFTTVVWSGNCNLG